MKTETQQPNIIIYCAAQHIIITCPFTVCIISPPNIICLHPFISMFLYNILNLYIFVQFFSSNSKPFHKLTPHTVMHMLFIFVLTLNFLKLYSPLKLYPPCLSINIFCIFPGSKLFLALYKI